MRVTGDEDGMGTPNVSAKLAQTGPYYKRTGTGRPGAGAVTACNNCSPGRNRAGTPAA